MLTEHEKYARRALQLVAENKPNGWDDAKAAWPPKPPQAVTSLIERAEHYLNKGCQRGNYQMEVIFALIAVAEVISKLEKRVAALEDVLTEPVAKEEQAVDAREETVVLDVLK